MSYSKLALLLTLSLVSGSAHASKRLLRACVHALNYKFSPEYREEFDFDEFLSDQRGLSKWLHYRGYKVYFRINEIYWRGQKRRALVISNITSDKPGRGGYPVFLDHLDDKIREFSARGIRLDGVKIEGVSAVGGESQRRQTTFYLDNEFEQIDTRSPSLNFFRPTERVD